MKPDFEKIAYNVINTNMRVKRGESVLIDTRLDNAFFGELLAIECKKIGADPIHCIFGDNLLLQAALHSNLEDLKIPSKIHKALLKSADVLINCYLERENPKLFADLEPARTVGMRNYSKNRWERIDKGNCRWLGIGFPTEAQSKYFNFKFDEFSEMFWAAVDIDYDKLSKQAFKIANLIKQKKEIKIMTRKGTNLTGTCGERPVFCDDGIFSDEDIAMGATLLNIPTGEVYFAPDEPTFSGTAVFDLVMREGTRIEDLELYFNEGRAQAISAKKGLNDYHKVMAGASGDKDVIGEIGIGLNPLITKMTGYMLTDEKIIGTAHLAIGNNITMGGINQSDIHWDMIINRPTILVGDELLMKDGEFAAEYQLNNIK